MKREMLVSIDMAELTLRMVEAGLLIKRPPDHTPVELLKSLPDDIEQSFHRQARAAADYFGEQMSAAMSAGGGSFQQVDLSNDGAGHA